MMARNEAGTLAALKRHHEFVFDSAVAQHNSRIVKLIRRGNTSVIFSRDNRTAD